LVWRGARIQVLAAAAAAAAALYAGWVAILWLGPHDSKFD
jgi:hypothetical protein